MPRPSELIFSSSLIVADFSEPLDFGVGGETADCLEFATSVLRICPNVKKMNLYDRRAYNLKELSMTQVWHVADLQVKLSNRLST